jgi:hypothetical protein
VIHWLYAFYAVSICILIFYLYKNFDNVKQVWLVDDCSAASPLDSLFAFFNQTIVEGEKFGYYVNSTKSWLIVKKHCDRLIGRGRLNYLKTMT